MRVELAQGATIGRYVLLAKLAQGGMANVWLARATGSEGFHKTVVVKTMLPHLADDPEFVRMFAREAVIAAQLDHPNIVHIFDLGEAQGYHFITMEYVSGRTLRHIQRELARTRRLPPPWLVLQVASAVCDALYHAHGKVDETGKPLGLVHRDISPENIMVAFTGETKVLDFGIAKATTVASKTRIGVLKGKHAYMAPEQIEGAMNGSAPTGAIDIYALGVVMYELITGRRPFRADNDLALMRQILDDPPRPPESFCSWVSPSLSALILKAMARNPAQRFQSASELRGAIDEYFASIRSHPTNRHVAEYVRSLFGDDSLEASAGAMATPASVSGLYDTGRADPWEAEPTTSPGRDSSLTIDLSMVLMSAEESAEVAPESSVGSTSSDRHRSTYPPSSLALPPAGWDPSTPQQRAVPEASGDARSTGELAGDVDDLDDWLGPPAQPDAVPLHDAIPRPPAAPTDIEIPAPATGGTGGAGECERGGREPGGSAEARGGRRGAAAGHFWDLATSRAREQRSSEQEEPRSEAAVEEAATREGSGAREGRGWDAVVDRLRRQDGADRGARLTAAQRRREQSAEVRATTLFEQGLEKMRAKDLQGALECWTKATELDPENRLVQGNLRVLKKQLAERDKAG